jgi:RNA polymerase sigma factor (sigma-70 family)
MSVCRFDERVDMGLTSNDISRLYARHAEELLAFRARRTLQAEVARDLLGETFAQAFLDRSRFRGTGDREAIAWIHGIAKGQLADYFRRGQVHRRALRRLGVASPSLIDVDLERIEELAELHDLRLQVAERLTRLSRDHRDALRIRIVEERDYPEVARALGVSEQAARARVSRALRLLRSDVLAREGATDHAEDLSGLTPALRTLGEDLDSAMRAAEQKRPLTRRRPSRRLTAALLAVGVAVFLALDLAGHGGPLSEPVTPADALSARRKPR